MALSVESTSTTDVETKKPAKPAHVGKSSVILDVKPLELETDLEALEAKVRAIEMPGLVWGGSELIPVAFKIRLIRIIAIIVDDLVSTDDLEDAIQAFEDCSSTEIFAFNKAN